MSCATSECIEVYHTLYESDLCRHRCESMFSTGLICNITSLLCNDLIIHYSTLRTLKCMKTVCKFLSMENANNYNESERI